MEDEGEPESTQLTVIPNRRITVSVKDIQLLTGKSKSTCYRIYDEVQQACGRLKHQFITIFDLSDYTGIPVELIYMVLPT